MSEVYVFLFGLLAALIAIPFGLIATWLLWQGLVAAVTSADKLMDSLLSYHDEALEK